MGTPVISVPLDGLRGVLIDGENARGCRHSGALPEVLEEVLPIPRHRRMTTMAQRRPTIDSPLVVRPPGFWIFIAGLLELASPGVPLAVVLKGPAATEVHANRTPAVEGGHRVTTAGSRHAALDVVVVELADRMVDRCSHRKAFRWLRPIPLATRPTRSSSASQLNSFPVTASSAGTARTCRVCRSPCWDVLFDAPCSRTPPSVETFFATASVQPADRSRCSTKLTPARSTSLATNATVFHSNITGHPRRCGRLALSPTALSDPLPCRGTGGGQATRRGSLGFGGDVGRHTPILDVGCGSGALLVHLARPFHEPPWDRSIS